MENMNERSVLLQNISDLMFSLQRAKNLVDEGKEVLCSRQLQGALVKCNNIFIGVKDGIMVDKNSEK